MCEKKKRKQRLGDMGDTDDKGDMVLSSEKKGGLEIQDSFNSDRWAVMLPVLLAVG